MPLTHLSLFSGIGGFDLACEWAGFATILFCERDPFCQSVLAAHWPGVPIHDDIRTLDGTAWRGATLLTGGFPCQPFSHAGKRAGEGDDRFLWPQMLGVIQAARPRWVVGENVAGIVNLALDRVCLDLEASGYEVAPPLVFPACAVGAWHRRDRVWIVAHADSGGRGADEPHLQAGQSDAHRRRALAHADGQRQHERSQCLPEGGDGARDRGAHVPDAAGLGRERAGSARDARAGFADGGGDVPDARGVGNIAVGRGTLASGGNQTWDVHFGLAQSGVGGSPDGVSAWLDGSWESDIPRVAVGVRGRGKRLRALGNAVVPQQAYPIIAAIAAYERGETV